MENKKLNEFIDRAEFKKPLPKEADVLVSQKKQWEEENNQSSELVSFVRHHYTNYDELLYIISTRFVEESSHDILDGVDDLEDDEIQGPL